MAVEPIGLTHLRGRVLPRACLELPCKGVFALAIEDEHIGANPADGIRLPKRQKPEIDPLDRTEMIAVLEALPSD